MEVIYLIAAIIACIIAGIYFFFVRKIVSIEGNEEVSLLLPERLKDKYSLEVVLSIKLIKNKIIHIFFIIISIFSIFMWSMLSFNNDSFYVVIMSIICGVIIWIVSYIIPYIVYELTKDINRIKLHRYEYFFIFLYKASFIFRRAYKKKAEEEETIDEDVLNEIVDSFEEEGIIEEEKAEMVRGAIELHNVEAEQIMTPRVDVFAIEINDDLDDLADNEEIFVHSRIPVYEETIDHIVGILPVKSYFKEKIKNNGGKVDIKKICYKPLFIASNYPVIDLLQQFKNSKTHIAIVTDEYGGTKGIITMEDILEIIVGDIYDEMDEVEEEIKEKSDGTYIVDGSMNIEDFYNEIGIEEKYIGNFVTLSGLCQEVLGRFPIKGDEFDYYSYHLKVLSMNGYVVDKIEVKKIEE